MAHEHGRRTGDDIHIEGDYQYRALTKGFVVQRYWHASKMKLVDALMPLSPDDRVLDCGCGSGVVADHAAASGATVLAVDSNEHAIEFARRQFQRPNLTFELSTADELPYPPGSFTRVLFLEVLEHLYAGQAAPVIARFHDLLQPGGLVLVTTPNYAGAWPLLEAFLDRFHLAAHMEDDQHVAQYTDASLVELVRDAGFTPLRHGTYSTFAPFMAVLGQRLADRFFRAELKRSVPFGNLLYVLARKPAAGP